MSPSPAIFISAASRELRTARQLVSNTLTFLGYEPEWQDIFSTEEGDLREMLRRRIDASNAVVQLVGQSYGAEPPAPDEQFGRVSYTQYEALYARQKKKKVWYLILNDDFTTDPHEPESQELQGLQNTYRARLQSENLVHHSLGSQEALEASVLKLRDELTQLRRGAKQWAAGVALLLLLSVGLGFWLLQRQQSTSRELAAQNQKLAAMDDKMDNITFLFFQQKLTEEDRKRATAGISPLLPKDSNKVEKTLAKTSIPNLPPSERAVEDILYEMATEFVRLGFSFPPQIDVETITGDYTIGVRIPVSKGFEYVFLAAGSKTIGHVRASLYDERGRVLAGPREMDTRMFSALATYNGTVQLLVEVSDVSAPSVFVWQVGRRGHRDEASDIGTDVIEPTLEMNGTPPPAPPKSSKRSKRPPLSAPK